MRDPEIYYQPANEKQLCEKKPKSWNKNFISNKNKELQIRHWSRKRRARKQNGGPTLDSFILQN